MDAPEVYVSPRRESKAAHLDVDGDGTMEEQSYSVYRDFSSVTSALRFRLRDHRSGKNDFSVSLMFSLKALPRLGLGDDSNRLETRLYR